MIIRRATTTDAADLRGVVSAAYAPFEHLGLPPVAEGLDADIRDHNVFVADSDGQICGGVVLVLGQQAHIANLAVAPQMGGRGIGQALLQHACDAAQAAGHGRVGLATHAGMTGTQAFYHKQGWVETGRSGNKVYFEKQLG